MSRSSKRIKIRPEELSYMALLNEVTGVHVRDCIIDEENNRVIFLVNPDEVGKAVGPRGINVQRLRKLIGKNIEIVGYSDDLEEQTRLALAPARVKEIRVVNRPGGRKLVYVSVEPNDKGIAIGRNGKNVARANIILSRYFDVDRVIIA
jgi:N utilization substance protein A